MKIVLADKYSCTGCAACIDICPKKAIIKKVANDGHIYVTINETLCVECRKCERLCNTIHTCYGINDKRQSIPFAAWANDMSYRKRGTSGGIFAALSSSFIQNGGVVVSSSFDGFHAKHIIISDVKDIETLQGSKYVQSDTEGIYKIIDEYLNHKKVLFFGVGCQCAAIIAYFFNHPYATNIYTVDMVCGGVPSSLLINKFRVQNPEVERITSFRNKRKYELRGLIGNKEVIFPSKNLPLAGFQVGLTYRYSCNNCRFAKIHRKTDLTIGDLWGCRRFSAEDYSKGISLVISHNVRGEELMKSADIFLNPIDWNDCLPYNKRIYNGKRKYGILREKLDLYAKKFDNEKFRKVYTFDLKPSDGFWYLYMYYWEIKNRISKIIKKLINSGKDTF